MCGICGYFSSSGHFSPPDLHQMSEAIAYRGPDAEGYFNDTVAGLGHRRLSIVDISAAANQPMYSRDERYVICYNGEVYNFKEIAKKLQQEDPSLRLKTTSDTEVILEAFVRWGKDCVYQFNGMFAIAIYDKKDETLFIFRDRMGIKPLYYFNDGKKFAFASELKALTKVPIIHSQLKINKRPLSTFLYLGYIPEPYTIYSNIFKLPAGTILIINKSGLNIIPYWNLEEQIHSQVITDFDAAKAKFKELLTESVRLKLICDVPYGIFLSGGTDSSLITAIAQDLTPHNVTTFTIGFKEAKYNEAPHAHAIAKYLKTEHHEFTVSYNDAIPLLEEILTTYDEPYADSSAIPTLLVSQLARKHVKMVLAGDGGDELFLGYGAYNWAKRLSNPITGMLRKPISQTLSILSDREKRAANLFTYPNRERVKSHIFSQEQYYFTEKEIYSLLNDKYKSPVMIDETYAFLQRKLSPAEEQAFFDIQYYLKDELLVKVDRATMRYGLEARVPYLDYNLVNFALNLSPDLKIHKGVQKYLLKETLYDYIPKKYFDRPKWGFSIPLRIWLKDKLRYFLDEYLSEKIVEEFGIVKYEQVRKLKEDFLKGNDYLYHRIWLLIILHKFFKNNPYPIEENTPNISTYSSVNRKIKQKKLNVLLFHRISPIKDALWQPISPSVFEKTIKHVSKKYEMVPLEQYLLGNYIPATNKDLCTITFDDGYKDFMEYALPILKKHACPSSLFVITDCITNQIAPWTYLLNYLFQHTKKMSLSSINAIGLEFKNSIWNNKDERLDYMKNLSPYLKSLTHRKRVIIVKNIINQFSDVQHPKNLMLSWEEIRQMQSEGVTIGSHTATHPLLAKKLSSHDIFDELKTSAQTIKKELGKFPTSISYPFGNCDTKIKQAAQDAGYKIGLTVVPYPYDNEHFDLLEVPRIEISYNNSLLAKLKINGILQVINQFR